MKHTLLAVSAIIALASAGTASAEDAVRAGVTPNTPPTPIVTLNGTGLTPGTYAIGTIQLFYTVQAFQFPVGQFATFNLDLAIEAGKPNPATAYPVPLTLEQTGSSNLTLTPSTSSFSVTTSAWTSSTIVTIAIPAGVPNDDGTDLVGNLQIKANGQSHLGTATTVQVHIKLVYPDECLKLYDFITDADLAHIVTSTNVNVNPKNKVTATTPYGQLSANLLVVNTCAVSETFDVRATLDPWFATNPSGNPGNAVFTYSTAGELDPSTFNIAAFGTGSPQGQSLQFTNVSVAAGDMFLMTVHISINKGNLWNGGSAGTFSFSGALYANGTSFGALLTGVGPSNPAIATLTYTQQ